jgi:hypothetical protein
VATQLLPTFASAGVQTSCRAILPCRLSTLGAVTSPESANHVFVQCFFHTLPTFSRRTFSSASCHLDAVLSQVGWLLDSRLLVMVWSRCLFPGLGASVLADHYSFRANVSKRGVFRSRGEDWKFVSFGSGPSDYVRDILGGRIAVESSERETNCFPRCCCQ